MSFDLVLREGRIAGAEEQIVDIGLRDDRIAAIAPHIETDAPAMPVDGRLMLPGFVDTHIHLDKSCIMDRCVGAHRTLRDAIAAVAAAKRAFTEDDVYMRARRTLERAIVHGTTHMRTHVEVDPRIGLRGFDAIRKLKRDYAWAIDLEVCVFPQEGLINDPGAEELLVAACAAGAEVIGGCPYTDANPHGHIARIFALAERFDLDIDLHLDFDIDPSWMHIDEVCRQTEQHRRGGRVAVGHVTKLSALPPAALAAVAGRLAGAGVAVTVLPATDLFMMGREHSHNVPRGVAPADRLTARGVTCSLATNNVLNPFTPFGDCSLIRIANLYANTAQLGSEAELAGCFDLVTTMPARLMNLVGYGIATGHSADIVVLDCTSRAAAIAELAQPIIALKNGRVSFSRGLPVLNRPSPPPAASVTST
jgi:cytosine/creatinine deaminase